MNAFDFTMEIQLKKLNATRGKAKVQLEADTLQKEWKKSLNHYTRVARFDGFRKGKTPPHLVEKRYGKELLNKTADGLFSQAYQQIKEETGLKICALVNLEGLEGLRMALSQGKGLSLSCTLDTHPEFELPPCEKFVLDLPPEEPSKEELKQACQARLAQKADYVPVDRSAEKGDYVKISYRPDCQEEEVEAWGKDAPLYRAHKHTWEKAGDLESPGVPAIVQGIVGLKKGEKKVFEQKFPESGGPVPALAGKTLSYEVEVHQVREARLPEINEAFLKEENVTTVEMWEAKLKASVKEQKARYLESLKRQGVLQKLLEQVANMPLPQSLVEREEANVLRELKAKQKEGDEKELAAEALKIAQRRIQSDFLITAIAEKEKIETQQEDLQKMVLAQAAYLGLPPKDLVAQLKKEPERIKALRHQALFEKTLALLAKRVEAS